MRLAIFLGLVFIGIQINADLKIPDYIFTIIGMLSLMFMVMDIIEFIKKIFIDD